MRRLLSSTEDDLTLHNLSVENDSRSFSSPMRCWAEQALQSEANCETLDLLYHPFEGWLDAILARDEFDMLEGFDIFEDVILL